MKTSLDNFLSILNDYSKLISEQKENFNQNASSFLHEIDQNNIKQTVTSKEEGIIKKISFFFKVFLPNKLNLSTLTNLLQLLKFIQVNKNRKFDIIVFNSKRGQFKFDHSLTRLGINKRFLNKENDQLSHSKYLVIDISNGFLNKNDFTHKDNFFNTNFTSILFIGLLNVFELVYLNLKTIFLKKQLPIRGTLIGFIGLKRIYKNFNINRIFFFTTNSRSTEIIRAFALSNLQDNKYKSEITEILHGAIDTTYKNYLISLSKKNIFLKNMKIVDCVPNLHKYFYVPGYKVDKEFYNSSWLLKSNLIIDQKKKLDQFNSDNLIIVFFGAPNILDNEKYIDSSLFALENSVLDMTMQIVDELNSKYEIYYSPHPQHLDEFKNNKFFDKKIRILPDSFFGFFISDVSIGICSTTLFESKFFGAESVMLLSKENTIFSESITKNILLIEDNSLKSIRSKIQETINRIIVELPPNYFQEKLRSRKKLLLKSLFG